MTKTRFIAGAVVLLLTSLGVAAPSANPPALPQEVARDLPAPEFPSAVDVVTVDAVVLDRDGNPLEGLTAEDFTVRDEGRIRPLMSFEAVTLPESPPGLPPLRARVSTNLRRAERPERTFVIVFDNIHMSQERVQLARDAVSEFILDGLAEGDRVTVVPSSGGAWWTGRIPDDRSDLVAALDRLQGERLRTTSIDRISDYEAMRLHLHRDEQVGAQVIRRYYEYGMISEPMSTETQADLNLGEGHPLIRVKAAEIYQDQRVRKLATLGLLTRVADSLASVKGRKSIMLVSEGFIQEPNMPEFRDVARAAREANAVIYFVDSRGLGGITLTADAEIARPTDQRDLGPQMGMATREALGAISVAADSGGFSIRNSNDFAARMRDIDRQSRSYYLFGFSIAEIDRNGKFRDIKVEVNRPGARVVARKGYYAPSDKPPKPRGEDELDPQIRTALDSPFDSTTVSLRMASYVLGAGEEGKSSVLFVADIDPRGLEFERAGDRYENVFSTYLLVSARDTGERFHKERDVELSLPPQLRRQIDQTWLPQVRDFQLPPGTYQARLLVRDQRSQRVGTVYHELEVPNPADFRVTTPILTDVLQPGQGGQGAPPRPIPLARDAFAPGRTIYYAFEIKGAQAGPEGSPRVQTGYRVETIDGRVIATQSDAPVPPGPNGSLSQMYGLNLTGVIPGDYVIVLNVRDDVAGRTLEIADPFEVTAAPESPIPGPR